MIAATAIKLLQLGLVTRAHSAHHPRRSANGYTAPVMTPQRALALARSGQETGFRWLFDRYYAAIYRLIRRTAALDADAAQDAAQNAFIRAFRSLDSLQKDNSFEAWLVCIARREAFRYLGKHRKAQAIPHDAHDPCQTQAARVESLERERLLATMHDVAKTVQPAAVRETALRYYFGAQQTTDQLAKELNVPPATVRKRLFLFRKKLREQLLARENR